MIPSSPNKPFPGALLTITLSGETWSVASGLELHDVAFYAVRLGLDESVRFGDLAFAPAGENPFMMDAFRYVALSTPRELLRNVLTLSPAVPWGAQMRSTWLCMIVLAVG